MSLKIKYAFSSHGVFLCEVEIANLPPLSPKEKKYHWLYISGDDQKVERFDFEEMGSEDGVEFREFKQASFCFDNEVAKLTFDEGDAVALDRLESGALPEDIFNKIKSFLSL